MMDVARKMNPPAGSLTASFLVGDIFQLPFPDRHFDAALCIRFMNLIEPPVRVRAVREMARVADVLIVSYDHKYTLKYFGRRMRHRLGLRAKRITPRLSRRVMADELAETGLKVERIVSVSPLFSEAWIAVLSHPDGGDRRCRKL